LDYLTTHTSLSPIQRDKVYQLLAHGRWFYPCTPASSTTKTGCHKILLKVHDVNQNKTNQIKSNKFDSHNISEKLLKMTINTNNPKQKDLTDFFSPTILDHRKDVYLVNCS
jgi:hypothetical protein